MNGVWWVVSGVWWMVCDEWCVMNGLEAGTREAEEEERRVQSEKQEPHTVMWGIASKFKIIWIQRQRPLTPNALRSIACSKPPSSCQSIAMLNQWRAANFQTRTEKGKHASLSGDCVMHACEEMDAASWQGISDEGSIVSFVCDECVTSGRDEWLYDEWCMHVCKCCAMTTAQQLL